MKWLSLIFLFGLISLSQAVILSLEENELGSPEYRYLYLTVTEDFTQKPFFTLVNGELTRPYGALGSLYCGTTTDGVAVYSDIDGDGLKEWTCQSINVLPFAHQGGGVPSPPICSVTSPTGLPALWNQTTQSWDCGSYNEILTLATRIDLGDFCAPADFMTYYADVDEIRCINPQDIDPSLTAQSSGKRSVGELEERVDVNSDKKWKIIMTGIDVTFATSKSWSQFQWSPFMNYDSTSASSSIPSPPTTMPFATTVVAVTLASFRISGYNWIILPPGSTDSINATVSKLSATLTETVVQANLPFDSITATAGTVTFGFTNNINANATAGETFVGYITARNWATLSPNTDRQDFTITLWIQTTQSFTSLWPLS